MSGAARTQALRLALNGRFVATVVRRGSGDRADTVTVTYDSDADLALTPALPVQIKPHSGTSVLAFLAGLLPDAEAVRLHWANQFGVADHPVELLAHMGLDCAGAVQFVPEGEEHLLKAGNSEYIPLSDAQIGERLRTLRTPEGRSSWTVHDEHWSLGGAQAKFALARIDGQWCEATGAAPTTHIFKPGIGAMKHQAAVEFATMRASRALGLATASVDVRVFDAEPTLVVERFDNSPSCCGGPRPDRRTTCVASPTPCSSTTWPSALTGTRRTMRSSCLDRRSDWLRCTTSPPELRTTRPPPTRPQRSRSVE